MGFEEDVDNGRRIDQDFSKQDYIFKAKIISSEYKQKITGLIDQYDFSQQCKIQLKNIVNVAFDPNAMLARNEAIKPRTLKLAIALNLAIVAMDESDVQNPGLLNIVNAIEDAFGDFVSRSIGGKERDNITKQEITSSSHQSYSGLPNESVQERRGLRLPWSGDR